MVTPADLSTDGEVTDHMVNPHFDPTEDEEAVLTVLKQENRANPYLIRERTDLGKGDVNTAFTRLTSAGWVRKVTRGLYEMVDDPREEETMTNPDGGASVADAEDAVETALEGWSPGQGGDDTRRRVEIGREVLQWLSEHGGPAQKADFVDALYEETHVDGQKPGSWWETTAREVLQHAAEKGVVKDTGKKYEWGRQ